MDELCALTGWNRDHARRAIRSVRLMSSAEVPEQVQGTLTRQYLDLNPVALKREIARLQDRLSELARRPKPPPPAAPADHP